MIPEELYEKNVEIKISYRGGNNNVVTISGVITKCKAGYIVLDDKVYINPEYVVTIEVKN